MVKTKIPFKVSARAGKLLGRENFSNTAGAIIELVKNSYDADAKKCFVIFNINEINNNKIIKEDCIYIIDNGEGMTQEVIENHWMQIGTGNKEKNYTTKNQRIKTGAKGIGRFALDRLGFKTEMWTISKESKNNKGLFWEMDWNQFDNPDKAISQIEATISKTDIDFKSQVRYLFEKNIEFKKAFESSNFSSGTLIRITNLKDDWNKENIKEIFSNLEALIPPKELNIPFDVYFSYFQQSKLYGKVETAFFNDYDYKVSAKFDSTKLNISFKITRNEIDTNKMKSTILKNNKHPYDYETLINRTFEITKSIDTVLKLELTEEVKQNLRNVGSFKFTFFYLKITNSRKEGYPFKSISSKERRAIIKRFGGIKIYRDSFRVRPYGNPNNDWLRLGYRAAQSPAGPGQRIGDWRVRPESIAGLITISRLINPLLIDKADRNALQENNVFKTFRNIIIAIIHEFEVDRTKILNPFYIYLKKERKKKEEDEINKRAEILAKEIVEERRKRLGKDLFSKEEDEFEKETIKKTAKNTIKLIKKEFKEQENKEIVQVRALASLGLIVTSFAHELNEIRDNSMEVYSLERIYQKLIKESEKKEQEYLDGIDIIELLKENDKKIKHWIDYSLTAIKKDKRKRDSFKFNSFFKSLIKSWKRLLTSLEIDLNISNNTTSTYSFRAFEMDINTIFTNLINNSIDSFNRLNTIKKREINIEYVLLNDEIEITYSDNGKGLSNVFEQKEDILLPFTTTKRNKYGEEIGTGLGMYLVKNVIDDNNGKIKILTPSTGFKVKIYFPIRKG